MNKQGAALIFGLLVIVVLLILSASFFLMTMNENNLVRRYVASTRAFWLAEAGIGAAIADLPSTTSIVDYLPSGEDNYQYSVDITPKGATQDQQLYLIESTGSVLMPAATAPIEKTIEAHVIISPPQPGNFDVAVEVQGKLKLAGNPTIEPEGSWRDNSDFTFEGKYNLTPEELRAIAVSEGTYYENPPSPLQDMHGISWVKITDPKKKLKIPKTGWEGSGILVVEGAADIEGGVFHGIIWVIGELYISGNPEITGTVVAECGTEITSVVGTPEITWDELAIQEALSLLTVHARKTIQTWRELP